METLLNTNLFEYINRIEKGSHQIDIELEYKNFTESLLMFYKSENDRVKLFLSLNYTRIEFVSVQKNEEEYRSGEKSDR